MAANSTNNSALKNLRPPAVPLIAVDPYFSIWSAADKLTDAKTTHWSGSNMPLCGMVRVDGQAYRIIGPDPSQVPALEQTSVVVLPTRTVYTFAGAGISLTVTFMTPALPADLDLLSWPLTYVNFEARSTDAKPHAVSVYFDALTDIAVLHVAQKVNWSRLNLGTFTAMRVGTNEQAVLEKTHTERIDWGFFYLAVPASAKSASAIANCPETRDGFAKNGSLPAYDDARCPRSVSDGWPTLATTLDLGTVNKNGASAFIALAYDDVDSVELFKRKLPGYWRKKHADIGSLLRTAIAEYPAVLQRCQQFDEEIMADLRSSGGEQFARLSAMVHRQVCAAHKLALDFDGTPKHFPKENYSGGFIATVDVHYPASPFFLLFNPELLKAQLTPVLDYSASSHWPYPFAPHDLGDYPLANGQTYGGTDLPMHMQMPVEECGNMLLMLAALAKVEGNAKYVEKYWPLMKTWSDYLKEKGLDPENQLCTDDFMGHLAHNANLSIKAILGIAAYGMLCSLSGKEDEGAKNHALAKELAGKWTKMAADGEHYRLAFDKAGSWSQKYNLVWDKLLGFNLFPAEVARKEVAHYLKNQQPYGLPLDSRAALCKNDWTVWSATMAESRADFEAIIAPLYRFADETTSRVALTDCYWCDKGVIRNFIARSVVGGFMIKLLADEKLWKKWSSRRS
jgi:hypothetical protein